MQRSKVQNMMLCALFAAMTAVLAQFAIPAGPVPINLATFAVFCAGALLGPKSGALSLAAYAVLGAFGLPVFSMLRGGLGVLLGPGGGFIMGYIPAAFATGAAVEKFGEKNRIYMYSAAMLLGLLICFAFGTGWFMLSTKTGFAASLMICVVPFLPGEAVKITAAAIIAKRLRPTLHP